MYVTVWDEYGGFLFGGAAEEKRRVGPPSHMQEVVVDFRAESLSSSELLK